MAKETRKQQETRQKTEWAMRNIASAAARGDLEKVENVYQWAKRNYVVTREMEAAYRVAQQAQQHEEPDYDYDRQAKY